jgi:gamma-glutamylcyclotransferase
MDSHHDQVRRAREQAAGSPPRLYFAYSTALDRVAFDEWRLSHGYDTFSLPKGEVAEALDVDLIYDFPSRFWGGRVAGLCDRPGSSVFGLLFEIPGVDWPIVEHKEGAVTHMCVARKVRVRAAGRELEAEAFTTRPERASGDGPISLRFREALIRGATSAGLPADYLDRLQK